MHDVLPFSLSSEDEAYVAQHLVRGKPVVPGTFFIALMHRAVGDALHVIEHTVFDEFVQLSRVDALSLEAERASGRTKLTLVSSFQHASGQVLRPRVLHASCEMTPLSDDLRWAPAPAFTWPFTTIGDPYRFGSDLTLGEPFDLLRDIRVFAAGQEARIDSVPHEGLLLDGWMRLASMSIGDGSLPLVVPRKVRRAAFLPGEMQMPLRAVTLRARLTGNKLICDAAWLLDASGRLVMAMEGLEGHRVGSVPVERARCPEGVHWRVLAPSLLEALNARSENAQFVVAASRDEAHFELTLPPAEQASPSAWRSLAGKYFARARAPNQTVNVTLLKGVVSARAFEFALSGDVIIGVAGSTVQSELLPLAHAFIRARRREQAFRLLRAEGNDITIEALFEAGLIDEVVARGTANAALARLSLRFGTLHETIRLRRLHETPTLLQLLAAAGEPVSQSRAERAS